MHSNNWVRVKVPKTKKANKATTAKTASSKPSLIKKGLLKNFPWLLLFEWFTWASIGAVAVVILSLSLQPWFEFAANFVSPNSDLVLLRLLSYIPFLGGMIDSALTVPIQFVGSALFVFFNINQIILLLASSNHVAMSSSKGSRIAVLSCIGYLFEEAVATMAHPPYQGGMSAFLADVAQFRVDPYYIQYGELVVVAALLFAFEVFVWMGVILIFAVRQARKSRKGATA